MRVPLLLGASCVFYMAFVPKYILILAVLILIDFAAGIWIENAQGHRRKIFLVVSLCANVGMLGFFKYFNFLNGNVAALAHFIGWNYSIESLKIILPIGLSFHTFQSMSYTIEVYRGRFKAERSLLHFATYVMFYPQLVAGPIERPQNLLHQFREKHVFNRTQFIEGAQLMLTGLFKKIIIADRAAILVNTVYANPQNFSGAQLFIATGFFGIQIYCDFCGYTENARGAAKIMGFELMLNFNRPYLATSIADFWRCWHISLSTWFRDYVYFPLGGNRCSRAQNCFNLAGVFLISGLWHGANWTFIVWGALHAHIHHHLRFDRNAENARRRAARRKCDENLRLAADARPRHLRVDFFPRGEFFRRLHGRGENLHGIFAANWSRFSSRPRCVAIRPHARLDFLAVPF